MAELCERSPNSFLATYRKIDGAEVISRNDRNLDCVITFQTHSILQRFMLRFEVLNMDCNDHLYIFDGAHVGAHKQDISCRNTKENLGTLFTRTNYITLKYVTDSWGTDNSFKLVITAIKDGSEDQFARLAMSAPIFLTLFLISPSPEHSCKDFRCATKEFCIHPDLLCDSVNHCEDGSDEAYGALCEGLSGVGRLSPSNEPHCLFHSQRRSTTTSGA
jgi:Low-density lipoprotein receptor domain class A